MPLLFFYAIELSFVNVCELNETTYIRVVKYVTYNTYSLLFIIKTSPL